MEEKVSIYKYMPTYIFNKEDKQINIMKYIFEDNMLWFSNPSNFNDPFELKPHIKNIVGDEADLFSTLINRSGQASEFYYTHIHSGLSNIGVLSLSSTKDNPVMWAHYANNHKGIVIEFDKENWFFNSKKLPEYSDVIHYLEAVKYKDERKSINSNNYWKDKDTYLVKSKDWQYEKEYRMTICAEVDVKYKDGIGIKFSTELIKSVYIGSKAEQEIIDYLKTMQKQEEWKHLKIYKFEIDKEEYKLNSKELINE